MYSTIKWLKGLSWNTTDHRLKLSTLAFQIGSLARVLPGTLKYDKLVLVVSIFFSVVSAFVQCRYDGKI